MHLLLFIFTVFVAFIVVRIGAIAFQITGLPKSVSQFQSLSCFSGTGFTTRESELIVVSRQRRRIAMVLMITGNAGFITLIAAFANSLRVPTTPFHIPYTGLAIPGYIFPWFNLVVIIGALALVNKLINHTRPGRALIQYLRSKLLSREIVKPVDFEELLVSTGGYGVMRMDVTKDSPVANTALKDGVLRKMDIILLAIERGGQSMPNPPHTAEILPGDTLICFGSLDIMREKLFVNQSVLV